MNRLQKKISVLALVLLLGVAGLWSAVRAEQHDYDIANQTFPVFRADLNNVLRAIATVNSGASAPATTVAYQFWLDSGTGLLKIRNATNTGWVTLGISVSTNNGADIDAGSIDGVTLGVNSPVTDARVDNIQIDGNTILSTNTNGNIVLTPNGTGLVVLKGLNMPPADGSAGDVVKTDGAGNLSLAGVETLIPANSIDGTMVAFGSDAQGDTAYYNGTDWTRLPAGTAGQVLRTNGAGANPAWANVPYDIAIVAGFGSTMGLENVAVQTYGEMVMARAGTFSGETGHIDTAPTGSALIVDVLKNGTTIYSTKPQFAAGANTLTAGTLSVTTFASGDRITFKVTQVGSTAAGQGVRFTLKSEV